MRLTKYLRLGKRKMSVLTLSELAGISTVTVYNLMGGRDVKGSILMKIERATGGKVKCRDLYEEFVERLDD